MQPKSILIASLFTTLLGATSFTGTGFGKDMKEAKHEALADLSESIKSEVKSCMLIHKQSTRNSADASSSQNIKVTSNLPLIGIDFELFDNEKNIEALASLVPSKAKLLYANKLEEIYKELETLHVKVQEAKNSVEKEKLLQLEFSTLNEYSRYKSVALVLGVENIPTPSDNRAQIQSNLLSLHSNIDSIAMAASILANSFAKYNNIYLYPPKQTQSHEITPFASALKLQFASKLKTALYPSKASYYLIGEYSETSDGLVLNYTLMDVLKRKSTEAKTIVLQSKAYASLRTKPNSISFDKLLHEGVVVSNKFKVAISTNKGSEDLLFHAGEDVELFVKFNKRGYYYIVGYTQTNNSTHAYLLELQEGAGDSKFTTFVNADDVNKWISLGAFSVEAPYGIENIQIVASNKKITQLPSHYYNEESGYYLLDGKSNSESLVKTRGLMKKKVAKDVVITSEAVLTFTTMDK